MRYFATYIVNIVDIVDVVDVVDITDIVDIVDIVYVVNIADTLLMSVLNFTLLQLWLCTLFPFQN